MTIEHNSSLAQTPPMSCNSWDCFGSSVTEAEVIDNAEFVAEHLLEYGWDTVVVDIQWYEPRAGISDYNPIANPELDAWGGPVVVREVTVLTRGSRAGAGVREARIPA
ncbi:hypothetical protein [Lacisediminihabitans sp.]|jgi:hypothetical protein|uniref:hypothetical protein n=1 Tax=Lacisediminihabitans sp. TaxID=2787631 RepID=UPI0039C99BAC